MSWIMHQAILRRAALLPIVAALAGCSTFPSTGPSASAIAHQAVRVETVTPEAAAAAWATRIGAEQQRVGDTLAALMRADEATLVRLYPGARLLVTLWTAPLVSVSSDSGATPATVTKSDLGAFTVDDDGSVTLPYVGSVPVAGRTLQEARALLDQRFRATRKFLAPQTTLALEANRRQQIIVSGAANKPTVVDWREGGVGLAEAITQAGGSVLGGTTPANALTANHVVIMRKGARYELPVKTALESGVQLRPNDQVVLQHQLPINITCLGGGWPQNTVQSFDEIPTLSRVVASGGGLSVQQAQGASVYVLAADRQTIYAFPWNTLAGLQAAQKFPLGDGDIVYIATAPLVRIQQVTNILFSAAYPVSVARSAR